MSTRKSASIAFVCEGDAEADAFSGTASKMVRGLRELQHRVNTFNVTPPTPLRLGNAALSFSPDRARWRARFRYGAAAFHLRSLLARNRLSKSGVGFDAILQIGANFAPPSGSNIPYAIYADWNMSLSAQYRDDSRSATSGLTREEERKINERQRNVYSGAQVIFTISERLRQSFIEDYSIAPERVVRAYPGANIDFAVANSQAERLLTDKHPCILFIGNEFERKGGDILLKAFEIVRNRLPTSRLVIVGPIDQVINQPGVEMLGKLRKHVPEESSRLERAFIEADVFCLPSRLDPFPNVVREAMFFGLPCVTTDIFAFPEMVVDGETGFTVPVRDVKALADRLLRILCDRTLGTMLGQAGRARALELFSWVTMAEIMSERVERMRRA